MYRRVKCGRVVSLGSIIIVKKKFLDTYLSFICAMYILYIYMYKSHDNCNSRETCRSKVEYTRSVCVRESITYGIPVFSNNNLHNTSECVCPGLILLLLLLLHVNTKWGMRTSDHSVRTSVREIGSVFCTIIVHYNTLNVSPQHHSSPAPPKCICIFVIHTNCSNDSKDSNYKNVDIDPI